MLGGRYCVAADGPLYRFVCCVLFVTGLQNKGTFMRVVGWCLKGVVRWCFSGRLAIDAEWSVRRGGGSLFHFARAASPTAPQKMRQQPERRPRALRRGRRTARRAYGVFAPCINCECIYFIIVCLCADGTAAHPSRTHARPARLLAQPRIPSLPTPL